MHLITAYPLDLSPHMLRVNNIVGNISSMRSEINVILNLKISYKGFSDSGSIILA